MDPGGGERHQVWTLDMENLAAKKLTVGDDWIRVFGSFSPSGESVCYASNERDEKFFDIYTCGVASGEKNLVYQNDATNYPLDWVDKDRILFTKANTNLDSDLYLLWPETAETAHLTKHSGEASFDYAGHAKDMSTLYVMTNKDREFLQPATIDVGTGHLDYLIEEDWDAVGGSVAPETRLLAYFRNVDGASRLHIYDLEKKQDFLVDGLPLGAFESPVVAGRNLMDWSPDSEHLVFSFQGPKHNLNLWLYDNEDQSVRQTTFVPTAAIPSSNLVEPEGLRFPSFDDLVIPVWAYRPANGRGSLPTVVFVHGGPESQETARFNIIVQYLVNRGFLVLAPNVRGSTGYGKKGVHLDDVDKRLDSVRDLEYLVKWAIGKGLAKPVEFMGFEEEGHGIAKIPNRVKAYTAIGDFLERTLLAPEKPASNA